MIKLLPTEKFTLITHLRPNRVEDKLLNFVEPYQLFRISFPFSPPPDKPYEGTVENGYFRIQKISRYKKRNNLPIVEGKIFPEDKGSLIYITIKPNQLLNFLMLFILFFNTSMSLLIALNFWFSNDNDARRIAVFFLLSPLWMGLIYYFVIKSFKSDVKKDKKFLLEIFE